MGKVHVYVEGYGEVVIKRPKKMTKGKFADAIGSAVAATMQLKYPRPGTFHPVLGLIKADDED